MSFATRLTIARIESECDKEDECERSEAVYQSHVRARAAARELAQPAAEAKGGREAKGPVSEGAAAPGDRWRWNPPGEAAAAKDDDGGDGVKADGDARPGAAAHRFFPRKPRSRDVVARALDYWRDFWKQYDDPEMMELFDFESLHYRDFDPDVDEHSHAHAALHREYRSLFERVLESHLKNKLDSGGAEFCAELECDLRSGDSDRAAKAAEFLEIVDKADDFAAFAESMRAAVRQARWLEEPD